MYRNLEDLQAEKWVFEKYVVSMLIGLSWLRIRSNGGIL
jgi:hypothetical protein